MNHQKTVFELFSELKELPKGWEKIEEIAEKKICAKNQLLSEFNSYPKYIYFITSGVVRKFCIDANGKEFTKLLFTENHIAGALTSLTTKTPNQFALECLTPVTLYQVPFDELIEIIYSDLKLSRLYIEMLHQFTRVLEENMVEKVTMESTERYLRTLKQYPGIENRIPLFHIASYLGITPIQLSRVRKKIKESS